MSGSSSSPGWRPLARRWLISRKSGMSIETSTEAEKPAELMNPAKSPHGAIYPFREGTVVLKLQRQPGLSS